MNILHTVEHYSPSVGGAQEVVRQVSERLVERGHGVTVATTRTEQRRQDTLAGVKIAEFAISGNAANGFAGEIDRYQAFLREGQFDVMLNYAAQQWTTDLALPLLAELPYARTLAPCGFSGLFLPEYARYFSTLPSLVASYDKILLHSNHYRDAIFLREHGIAQTRVIPNGASAEEFADVSAGDFRQDHGIPARDPLVLSVGSHTGMKGHRLVLDAFAELRTPRATLVLIGNTERHRGCLVECQRRARTISLRSFRRKRVILLDLPRAEVVHAYAAADLFVLASKVEASPLVLFEAAASATPFVTLPVGNAEEIAALTSGGVVVPASVDPAGFVESKPAALAAALDELLEDPARRVALGAAGRQAWNDNFRWDQVAPRYEELYTEAIAERRARSVQSLA